MGCTLGEEKDVKGITLDPDDASEEAEAMNLCFFEKQGIDFFFRFALFLERDEDAMQVREEVVRNQ